MPALELNDGFDVDLVRDDNFMPPVTITAPRVYVPPVRVPAPVAPLSTGAQLLRLGTAALRPLVALFIPGNMGPPGTGEIDPLNVPVVGLPDAYRVPDEYVPDAPEELELEAVTIRADAPPRTPPPANVGEIGNDPIMPPNWWDLINQPFWRELPGWPTLPIPLPAARPVPRPTHAPIGDPGLPAIDPGSPSPLELEPFGVPAPAPGRPAPNLRPATRPGTPPGPGRDPQVRPTPQPGTRPAPTPTPGPGNAPGPALDPFPDWFTSPFSPTPRPPKSPTTTTRPPAVPFLTIDPVHIPTDIPWDQPDDLKQDPCNCTKTKTKKKKEKKERVLCRRGTYRQLKKGIVYHPKEYVPCDKHDPASAEKGVGEIWKQINDRLAKKRAAARDRRNDLNIQWE